MFDSVDVVRSPLPFFPQRRTTQEIPKASEEESVRGRTREIQGLVHTFEVYDFPTSGGETSFDVTTLSEWGPKVSTGDSFILSLFFHSPICSCVV
ncbi:hypothetical protein AVEN_118396-1 [Araneus ventricosus]|uniref:Uncharacterized protein n=1 Tax=Araneus ventricosus TaxID=182803 RepID=A0A4Y2B856_ARAVE|nr:hypothetical protein AVEN_118396-1 [Araneus ventricosus]